jgi:hypothetical protein
MTRRAIVIGWFSFELMGATAGDVIAKDLARTWLEDAGYQVDVAVTEPEAEGEVATHDVVPERYGSLVFVCGPIGDAEPLSGFLSRFDHAQKLALNVSLLQERAEWNPFTAIVERDSSDRVNPDVTFAAPDRDVPVAGLILVGPQDEYPTNRHDDAERMLRAAGTASDIALVPVDTRLDVNRYGLRSAAQVESVIARLDAVLTTRLHGAALALRRGVPAVVVDSVPGGTKLLRQMRRIGWPLAFDIAEVDQDEVTRALDWALTPAARQRARECAEAARRDVAGVEREFLSALGGRAPEPSLR